MASKRNRRAYAHHSVERGWIAKTHKRDKLPQDDLTHARRLIRKPDGSIIIVQASDAEYRLVKPTRR